MLNSLLFFSIVVPGIFFDVNVSLSLLIFISAVYLKANQSY
jgi:hypothetical protein